MGKKSDIFPGIYTTGLGNTVWAGMAELGSKGLTFDMLTHSLIKKDIELRNDSVLNWHVTWRKRLTETCNESISQNRQNQNIDNKGKRHMEGTM